MIALFPNWRVDDADGNEVVLTPSTPQSLLLEAPRQEFQQQMYNRPEHPSFRALCGLLNREGNWSSLVLMEWVHEFREPPKLEDEYGFVLLLETPDGFRAYTNASDDEESHEYAFRIRRLNPDAKKCRTLLDRMDSFHSRLPPALVYQGGADLPMLVLHYVGKDKRWSCAVQGPDLSVMLGERRPLASDPEVLRLMRSLEREGTYRNVVLPRDESGLLDRVANRYTIVANELWSAAPPWPVIMERYAARGGQAGTVADRRPATGVSE